MTNTTQAPTAIAIDPYVSLKRYVGRTLGYVTADGQTIIGTTEIGTSAANQGRLIVRLPDGRWGFANYTHKRGAR